VDNGARNSSLLSGVKLLAMDVDGVLTDGTIGFSDGGLEQKRFHVADGLGLRIVRLAGVHVAWLSGRKSTAVSIRAAELGIDLLSAEINDKGAAIEQIMASLRVPREAAAFIGDDWNDLLAFEVVGVRIAVADAADELLRAADLVTTRRGGRGAVREVCNALLEAQGMTASVLARYLASLRLNTGLGNGAAGQ
jgi:3-deoxy-D-manno-octulosonate 8-phosphate phosphatase (KDO 8-P phosphatase)